MELSTATFGLEALQQFFSEEASTVVTLLEVQIVAADERVAHKLNLNIGDNTIYIRRLLTANDEPILYHRAYLVYDPTRPIVEAEMDVTSLHGLFTNLDSTLLRRGELFIQATLMRDDEAKILQTTLPAAAFNFEHLFYDFDNKPISWGWFICRNDRIRFATTIGIESHP